MLVFHRFSRYGAGVFLAASVSLTAFDLTLKTGEMLSGVSITGVSPQGIRLRWDGGETRFIRYDALSPASLKTISDFTPLPAEGTAAADENREPPILPDTVGTVYFHSVRILQGGTLGWAESSGGGAGGAPTQFGKVYINGLFIPQGNVWTGEAYPTRIRVRHLEKSYPCWALSPSAARRIDLAEE